METLTDEIQAILSSATDEKSRIDGLNKYAFANRNSHPISSLEIAEKARKMASSIGYKKGEAEGLLTIGFCEMHASQHERAYQQLFDALKIFTELGDETGIASVEYTIGIVHLRIGNFEEAVNMLHKSLAYREKQNDKAGMAACYFQLSYVNQHFNDEAGMEENISRSLSIRKEINDEVGTGASLMLLGEFYLRKKDLVKAREALEQSMTIRRKIGETLGYFASLLRFTELLFHEQKIDEAKKIAMEGLEMARKENVNFGVMRFLQILARIDFSLGNTVETEHWHRLAMESAEKYSFRSIIYELHESYAAFYKQKGDFEKALDHYEKFIAIKQEVINFQSNTRLKSMQLINQIDSAIREAEFERRKNEELKEAYAIIEEKNKNITDSIRYAKRIQLSLLPTEKYIDKNLKRFCGDS